MPLAAGGIVGGCRVGQGVAALLGADKAEWAGVGWAG